MLKIYLVRHRMVRPYMSVWGSDATTKEIKIMCKDDIFETLSSAFFMKNSKDVAGVVRALKVAMPDVYQEIVGKLTVQCEQNRKRYCPMFNEKTEKGRKKFEDKIVKERGEYKNSCELAADERVKEEEAMKEYCDKVDSVLFNDISGDYGKVEDKNLAEIAKELYDEGVASLKKEVKSDDVVDNRGKLLDELRELKASDGFAKAEPSVMERVAVIFGELGDHKSAAAIYKRLGNEEKYEEEIAMTGEYKAHEFVKKLETTKQECINEAAARMEIASSMSSFASNDEVAKNINEFDNMASCHAEEAQRLADVCITDAGDYANSDIVKGLTEEIFDYIIGVANDNLREYNGILDRQKMVELLVTHCKENSYGPKGGAKEVLDALVDSFGGWESLVNSAVANAIDADKLLCRRGLLMNATGFSRMARIFTDCFAMKMCQQFFGTSVNSRIK